MPEGKKPDGNAALSSDGEPLFRLGQEATPEGLFPLYQADPGDPDGGWKVIGWLRRYDPGLVDALNLLSAVGRSPATLEGLLTAPDGPLAEAGLVLASRKPN